MQEGISLEAVVEIPGAAPRALEQAVREAEQAAKEQDQVNRVLDVFCNGKGWDALSQELNALARLKGRNGRALPALAKEGQ